MAVISQDRLVNPLQINDGAERFAVNLFSVLRGSATWNESFDARTQGSIVGLEPFSLEPDEGMRSVALVTRVEEPDDDLTW